MTSCIRDHECTGIDCERCIAAEREAAERSLANWQTTRTSKFTKPRAKRSAALSAKPMFQLTKESSTQASTPPALAAEEQPSAGPVLSLDAPPEGQIANAAHALQFMLAGNAYFTLRSIKTGTRYTYRVSAVKDQTEQDISRWGKKYFVALLTGPENTGDYTYLGMIQGNRFRLTTKSKMTSTSGPVKAFEWTLNTLIYKGFPQGLEFWHVGRCGRCGRMLTVPDSIAAGIGPECAGKVGL